MTTRIVRVERELALLALSETDAERRRVIDSAVSLIKEATRNFERIKELSDSEAAEPLDDAIDIATRMLEAKP